LLLLWIPLNVLIIAGLLRGDYRRYPLILAYVVVEFLATAAEVPAYWAVYSHRVVESEDLRNFVYWLDEAIAQVLIYAVVISLIYSASRRLAARRLVRWCVTTGAVAFAAGSFAIEYVHGGKVGLWMAPWTRDLVVCAAVLDLALWGLLIASRERDERLLLLSGALGIQFTGQAIGWSIIQVAIARRSHQLFQVGSPLVVIADLVRSFIWWRVFRSAESPTSVRTLPARTAAEQAPQK
jgi:hypothetical protein